MMRIIHSPNHNGMVEKMSEPTKDSRKKSLSEALVNSFGGYPIGYGLGIVILPLSTGWIQEDPLVANVVITFVYALVSFVRTYVFRRLFERLGFDDNFIRFGIKMYSSIRIHLRNSRSVFYTKCDVKDA